MNQNFRECLVIGGSGMVGYEIARQLLDKGKNVRIMDLTPVDDNRVDMYIGDICNAGDVKTACKGMDIVFQTAAAVWDVNASPQVYEEVNIKGNRLVIDSCKEENIKRLIYTSTMDVVHEGKKPIINGDESLQYPEKEPEDHYCRTKIIAEKMVLQANSSNLLTCAIRPVGIYGPRDRYHLPNIIKAAKDGLKFRLGNGSAKFCHVYSENVAHAHILAAENLYKDSPIAGSSYFIGDDVKPENLFDFMAPFLEALGFTPPTKRIPYPVAYFIGWLNELLNPGSNFNRFSVVQTCVTRTFLHNKAVNDFGYYPLVSEEEAFKRTLEWFKERLDSI